MISRPPALLFFFWLTLILVSCNERPTSQQGSKGPSQPREGEWISRRADGSIKTRINYQNGRKHGMSYLYYEDGKSIQLELPYVVGARHGVSKKYYKDGTLYAETSYQSDDLHGLRKTYFSNGKLKSALTYSNGNPGTDLEEYVRDGEKKELPVLQLKRRNSQLELVIDGKSCKSPRFFIGTLDDDEFYNDRSESIEEIWPSEGRMIIDLNTFSESYLALQDIICVCKSTQGNPYVQKIRYRK